MARLNIAEKRVPQDGRIKLRVSGREIDIRVSMIPMLHGEGIVMRILDKDRMNFSLRGVGMGRNGRGLRGGVERGQRRLDAALNPFLRGHCG